MNCNLISNFKILLLENRIKCEIRMKKKKGTFSFGIDGKKECMNSPQRQKEARLWDRETRVCCFDHPCLNRHEKKVGARWRNLAPSARRSQKVGSRSLRPEEHISLQEVVRVPPPGEITQPRLRGLFVLTCKWPGRASTPCGCSGRRWGAGWRRRRAGRTPPGWWRTASSRGTAASGTAATPPQLRGSLESIRERDV